jgi:hypothetical protein
MPSLPATQAPATASLERFAALLARVPAHVAATPRGLVAALHQAALTHMQDLAAVRGAAVVLAGGSVSVQFVESGSSVAPI